MSTQAAHSEDPSRQSSFAKRAQELLKSLEYRRADTDEELDKIINLRYRAYLREGAIQASESERLVDSFDELDNAYNFAIYYEEKLISALRIHCVNANNPYSPAVESFGDILTPLIAEGKTLIDPNRFVADFDLSRHHPEIPFLTLRIAHLASLHFNANVVTMTVRAEHQAFYKRGLFGQVLCPPRTYPLLSKPISLLAVDFQKELQRLETRHPYWITPVADRDALFAAGPTRGRMSKR